MDGLCWYRASFVNAGGDWLMYSKLLNKNPIHFVTYDYSNVKKRNVHAQITNNMFSKLSKKLSVESVQTNKQANMHFV